MNTADSREPSESTPGRAGLTLRSLSAIVLTILLTAIVIALSGVFDSANSLIGSEALPVPALLVVLPLLSVCAMVAALSRFRALERAELVCVLFASLMAAPLMSMGFWRYQLAGLSTIVRLSDWTKFEALPEGLWPHGDDLLKGVLDAPRELAPSSSNGGSVDVHNGVVSLSNRAPASTAAVRVRLALGDAPHAFGESQQITAVPGRPYLLTALVRANDLAADASYFLRLYADDEPAFASEPVSARQEAKRTPLLADGFVRVGFYPLSLPGTAKRSVTLELGLRGAGVAKWRDLRLYDVRAIEAAYKGYTRVTRAEFQALSLAERQTALVVPDSWFSARGLRYLSGFSYPIADFRAPILRLGAFAGLVFAASLGLALIYRKQWLTNERFPLPMARVLLVVLGADETHGGLGARFLRNRWLWFGFVFTFVWCLFKVLYGYFPSLPDLRVNVSVKSYLADAFWGRTWDGVDFQVVGLFLGLALFMELNVLLSLVLGFLGFRLQYWLGQSRGLTQDQDFPYFSLQMLGAYLAYGALLVFATRRYLGETLRGAFQRGQASREVGVQRLGLGLFVAAILGFGAWGRWLGLPLVSVGVLCAQVLLMAWIGQKFRAECGLPSAGFNHPLGGSGNFNAPLEPMLLVPLLGGISVFGGSSLVTMSLITAVVLPYGFFLVPGLQVELLEVGRRFGVRTSHLVWTAFIGVAAAIVIGGWVYLMSAYGFGAARFPVVSDFGDRVGAFRVFNAEYASAQSALSAHGSSAAPSTGVDAGHLLALGFGAAGATFTAVLRQSFPGFWFHPVGFLVGASSMMQAAWGSLLVAYLVRLSVLRLGGAATVREKLIPAASGIFLGSLAAHALYIVGNAYWFFFSKGNLKFTGLL